MAKETPSYDWRTGFTYRVYRDTEATVPLVEVTTNEATTAYIVKLRNGTEYKFPMRHEVNVFIAGLMAGREGN